MKKLNLTLTFAVILMFVTELSTPALASPDPVLAYDDGTGEIYAEVHITQYLRQRFLVSDFGLSGDYLVKTVRICWWRHGPEDFTGVIKLRDRETGDLVPAASFSNPAEGWQDYDVSGSGFVSDDFYVELWQTAGYGYIYADTHTPHHYRSEVSTDSGGTWHLCSNMDFMIRVVVTPLALLLLNPNGSETLIAGTTYDVNWTSTGSISDVKIEYSANNGAAWNDVNTVPNTGLYSWLVPTVDSNQCLVRISDASDPSISDISDGVFTIQGLPDLLVTSEDITFDPIQGVRNEPVTIFATIQNTGPGPAAGVEVVFKDFDDTIGSQVISSIQPGDSNTVSIQHTWDEASFRLITIEVDPNDEFSELDEENNTASKIYQVGTVPDMNAVIVVLCNPSRTWPEGSTATISGEAFYRIEAAGYQDFEYPLKGGSVSIRVTYDSQLYYSRDFYTDTAGRFSDSFAVPGSAGDVFDVNIAVTDGTLTGTWGPEEFHIKEYKDLWVGAIVFSVNEPNVTIEAVIHASSQNTQTAFNVPVSFYVQPPQGGSQIGETQYIGEMGPSDSNTVSVTWEDAPNGVYCIEVELGPGYSDDDNRNNQAMCPVVVGPVPISSIDVDIESPLDGVGVNASQTIPVTVSVTDNSGNGIPPCAFESLLLKFTEAEVSQNDLKDDYNWETEQYEYQWRPEVDTNGLVCLEVTAETVELLGSLTDSNSICLFVNDDVPPTFRIYAYPYWARIGQSVRIYVDASEQLLNDRLDSNTVTDNAGQPIGFSLVGHPWSTRWILQTVGLPEETARGTATIDVNGTDMHENTGSGAGHFHVVDVVPDLYIHSEDIDFFDSNGLTDVNPHLGETITIKALVHASSTNTSAVNDVPVTFSAHHIAGDYVIGETQYIAQILPDTCEPADVNWTNAAEGVYIIEVELGPGFSDDNGGNNEATRAILVGEVTFVATFDVNGRTRIDRTWFRYKCWIIIDNLSPLDIENVRLELVGVPDNMEVNDPCVSYPYIEAESSATSEDTNDACIIDVNRAEPINPTEIVWRITYEIAGTGEGMQQMSSTVVLLEPVGLARGDITGEGIVDIDDLMRMADDWLQSGSLADIYPPPPYGDDVVNFQDFAVLAENWLAEK